MFAQLEFLILNRSALSVGPNLVKNLERLGVFAADKPFGLKPIEMHVLHGVAERFLPAPYDPRERAVAPEFLISRR